MARYCETQPKNIQACTPVPAPTPRLPHVFDYMRKKMAGSAAKKIETGYKHQNRNNNYTEQLSSKSKRVNLGLCKIIVVYSGLHKLSSVVKSLN